MVQKIDIDIEKIFDDIAGIEADDNTKELLQNGVPAYIKEPNMPQGIMLKLYPNGTKVTVRIDKHFHESVISA
ncbi:MAG TPA: hypothetical protein EYG73_09050 [Arcobacter sp.]|nr:hypothetical protein [Arcobacter sp.]